ncbi:MAG: hypothetical protein A3F98_03330 [Candidatus Yanofskybacteria bacterium RIFCSPLOWO2_12_FULL_41_8]|nr:MAG: hypothetical protein A3F98_03330 [Candidatus Yanofskybacteria bacterium RIFCSPLOWO2_12_FULL_41_8]
MAWTRRFIMAFVIVAAIPTIVEAQDKIWNQADSNSFIIGKLSEMTGAKPSRVTITYVAQKELHDFYLKEAYQECLASKSTIDISVINGCRAVGENARFIIYGRWNKDQNDPSHLDITLWREAGFETLVHEFVHWWLNTLTPSRGLLDDHTILSPIVNKIITEPEFLRWLEKVEKARIR